MRLAQDARLLERSAADMRWDWTNKAAVNALRQSEEADARALRHIEEMEQSNAYDQ